MRTRPLLDVLRKSPRPSFGTKFGCGQEQCGLLPWCWSTATRRNPAASRCRQWRARPIVTIEGNGDAGAAASACRQAFLDEQAGQCGYCLAGILISAKALLDRNPVAPRGPEDRHRGSMNNICRLRQPCPHPARC